MHMQLATTENFVNLKVENKKMKSGKKETL